MRLGSLERVTQATFIHSYIEEKITPDYQQTVWGDENLSIHYWDDGGGQYTLVALTNKEGLILVFDHESPTDFYNASEQDLQDMVNMYDETPRAFHKILFDGEFPAHSVNQRMINGKNTILSSGVLVKWSFEDIWSYPPAYEALVEKYFDGDWSGDFNYGLNWFQAVSPDLSLESILGYYRDAGYEDDEEVFDIIEQRVKEALSRLHLKN